MTSLRSPLLAALCLCASAFCYAQAPPPTEPEAAQSRTVTMPADIVREQPRDAAGGPAAAQAPEGANAMGAPAALPGPERQANAPRPAEAAAASLGRYGDGYLP